jgi:hypothetical protein
MYDYDSLDALLSPSSTDVNLFSTYSPLDNNSVYNTQLWGGGGATLDWTGIAWHDVGGTIFHPSTTNGRSIAITRRHCLSTHHGGDPGNGTLHFIAADGTLITRTIIGSKGHIGNHGGGIVIGGGHRFTVYYLNQDLPEEITQYPIFADTVQSLIGKPVIKFGIGGVGGRAGITDFLSYNYFSYQSQPPGVSPAYIMFVKSPSDSIRLQYNSFASVSGHSGSPVFILDGSQLLYVSNLTLGSNLADRTLSDGGGPVAWWLKGLIDAACKELDTADTGYMPVWWGLDRNAGGRSLSVRRSLQYA